MKVFLAVLLVVGLLMAFAVPTFADQGGIPNDPDANQFGQERSSEPQGDNMKAGQGQGSNMKGGRDWSDEHSNIKDSIDQ